MKVKRTDYNEEELREEEDMALKGLRHKMAELFLARTDFRMNEKLRAGFYIFWGPSTFAICNKPEGVPEIWSPESFVSV